jgi:hypothetical protein
MVYVDAGCEGGGKSRPISFLQLLSGSMIRKIETRPLDNDPQRFKDFEELFTDSSLFRNRVSENQNAQYGERKGMQILEASSFLPWTF